MKKKAYRSLEQKNYDTLVNFCFLLNYRLTRNEKKFAETNNIPNKLLYEAKKMYQSKGKTGVKNLFKQKKMITKGNNILAFFKSIQM